MAIAGHGRRGQRPLIAAAAMILLLAAAGCDSAEERAQRHFERGAALVAEGSDEKASLEFRNALRLQRGMTAARMELAGISERRGDARAALGGYAAVVEAEPQNVVARLKLGQILLAGGDVPGARTHLDEAVRLAPDDADARGARAAALLRQGDPVGAVVEAEAALALDAANVAAQVVLISERLIVNDDAAAMTRIAAALAQKPTELSYNLLKLQALEKAGDAAQVGAQLQHLSEIYPEQRGFRRALAQWRLRAGDIAGAEAALRSLADDGADMTDLTRLAQFIERNRGIDAARGELAARVQSAAAPGPRGVLRQALADLELRDGRITEAKALLQTTIDEAAGADIVNPAKVRLAASLLAEGDRKGAVALADQVIAEDKLNGDALAIRAGVAIEELRPEDAIADLRLALSGDADNPRLMLMEATAHERNGNLVVAGERLAAASRASNFEPEIVARYAQFLRSRNDARGAEAALSESSRRRPGDARILAALAETRLALGDWVGAEQAASELRGLDGGATAADRIAAASLGGQGRIEESIALLERVAAGPQSGAGVVASLVSNYVRNGQADKAAAFLDDILSRAPDDFRALLLRAELDLLAGDSTAAQARLERAIAANPANPVGYTALARFHMAAGRGEEAERLTREGLEGTAQSETLRFLLAQLLEARGAFDAAIAEYEILFEQRSESTIYANNLASLIAEHHADDPERLALAARVAQRLRGYDIPHFKDTYGWVLFLQGDNAAALEQLEAAAAQLPENPTVRYHLGRVYAALARSAEARENLEAALALDPVFSKRASAEAVLATLP